LSKVEEGQEWGVFIMRRFPMNISDSILGNIKYRNNVVTGEIAVDNGNNTYDVYIAGSDSAYPNIPTTLKEPSFAVGEAVEILIEYGSKEMPMIIGRSKKIVQEIVDVDMNVIVTTLDAYSINTISAYLELRIEEIEGYENCTKYGFYYGTTTAYGLDKYSTGSFAAGSYNEQVTELDSGTSYHFQAYVLDADGDEHTGYDKTFVTTVVSAPKIFVYLWDATDDYCIKSYTTDGTFIATIKSEPSDFTISRRDTLCVDSDDNIYYIDVGFNIIRKLDKDGNLLLSKDITWGEAIAIGPDGFIYVREYDSEWNDCIIKRNRSDLEIVSTIAFPYVDRYNGLVLDSDGYIYSYQYYTDLLEKWDFTSGVMVASRALVSSEVSLSVVGSLVGGLYNASPPNQYAWTIPTSLDEDKTDWDLDGIARPFCTSSIGSNFLYGGSLKIAKYQINRTKVWETTVSDNNTIYQMAAYPF